VLSHCDKNFSSVCARERERERCVRVCMCVCCTLSERAFALLWQRTDEREDRVASEALFARSARCDAIVRLCISVVSDQSEYSSSTRHSWQFHCPGMGHSRHRFPDSARRYFPFVGTERERAVQGLSLYVKLRFRSAGGMLDLKRCVTLPHRDSGTRDDYESIRCLSL
jgi:hypothetical protein